MIKIIKVIFTLHPTFGNQERKIKNEPFTLTCTGWGTFNIPIKIIWNNWLNKPPIQIDHMLSFEKNITQNSLRIEIDNRLIQ